MRSLPLKLIISILLVVTAGLLVIAYLPKTTNVEMGERINSQTSFTEPQNPKSPVTSPEVVVDNLQTPWEVASLPNGSLLITERPGNLVLVKPDKTKVTIPVPEVTEVGEGGLLGLALDPDFESTKYIYLYYTTGSSAAPTNRLNRFLFANDTLTERTSLLSDIPGGSNHNGGRIAFGPDGMLYIGTGDAGNGNLAQNTNSPAGKILRLTKNGAIPADNPFKNAVYSYGHRNVQGLAWDDQGQLWATEHGPSGTQTGYDELNLIEKGGNYGWPTIKGSETREGMHTPVINSGSTETWAPAGAIYKNGSIFFGGLRGQTLYQAKISANTVDLVKHFAGVYGRIRIVAKDGLGNIYLGSSNTDGRGTAKANDDKLIRISEL